MSGPKYSDIELERERQEMLRRQLEAEIEAAKCRELREEINQVISQTNSRIARLDIARIENNMKMADAEMEDKELIDDLASHIQMLRSLENNVAKPQGDSEKLKEILNQNKERQRGTLDQIKMIQELSEELHQAYSEVHQSKKESDFESRSWTKKEFHMNMTQELSDVFQELQKLIEGRDNHEKLEVLIKEIVDNPDFDDSYKASQLKMRLEGLQIEAQREERNREMISDLTVEYNSLCELFYGEHKEIPKDVDSLSAEIRKLKEMLEERKSDEYISKAVKTVMSELGYNISSEEILTEQRMQKQFYDYSPNSVVTIATSSSGAVMLEVVGKNDAGGNNSKAAVRMDMERFCPDYERIKEGLKAYGIVMTDKKLFPPDEKYVRFIDVEKSSDRRVSLRKNNMRLSNE